ncbi:MAG TPA: HEAT repeat domain-containing protein, partial [Polyangiaceae bacterium]|nr:HEAT repeat domain-containing protein [Polyangiaceae bacterium]
GGRRVALEILDQAPCEASLPVYLQAFSGPFAAHAIHARDHIRRCGKAAAPFLAAAAKQAKGPRQIDLLGELLLADAAQCVDVIVSLLDVDSRVRRTSLRIALARASTVSEAKPRVLAVLEDPALSERVTVDVLRALGSRISEFQPAAAAAIARLSRPDASFRTRFLLLAPSAELATADPALRASLATALASDPDPRFRTQALSVLKDPTQFSAQVSAALRDPDVRVRQAAIRAGSALPDSVPALSELLAKDPWPFVRMAAADALAEEKSAPSAKSALARAIGDESPHVRAHVIVALGEHHASSELGKIRERLLDEKEYPMVRAAAAKALAALCDTSSLDALTGYAHKLTDPMASPQDHVVGSAALLALGEMHPADLAQRLEPLRAKGAPPQAHQAADAVMQRKSNSCGAPAPIPPGARPAKS